MEKLDILVVGGGGREHAVCAALRKSEKCGRLYCAPGNGGISEIAECVPVKATDLDGIVAAAKNKKVSLVFVTPDDPLVMGLCDRLAAEGISSFGPMAAAARIEGSKVFSKQLMKRYGIPTASYEVFDDPEAALGFIKTRGEYPTVIKADGLALGKGVIIAEDYAAAENGIKQIMTDKIFGASGDRVVIEEFLTGPEVSVLAFCDGRTIKPMASAQDHKRAYDYDKGPNTGGMGAFSPSNKYTDEIADICMNTIFIPTVNAMIAEGCPFRGVIYFGLMLTPKGPRVIEYNARFGDPETQVVLPRMKTDLIDIVLAVNSGTLDKLEIEFSADACACVVAASGGYPVKYEKGFEISGIDKVNGAVVYHAGTTKTGDKYYTSGGRVLCVSALAPTLDEAVKKAYEELKKISFEKMHYRTDIGKK